MHVLRRARPHHPEKPFRGHCDWPGAGDVDVAVDGNRGAILPAEHLQTGRRAQDLSVSAARPGSGAAEPGVGDGHHSWAQAASRPTRRSSAAKPTSGAEAAPGASAWSTTERAADPPNDAAAVSRNPTAPSSLLAWISQTRAGRGGEPGRHRAFQWCVASGWPAAVTRFAERASGNFRLPVMRVHQGARQHGDEQAWCFRCVLWLRRS